MRINNNVMALNAHRQLGINQGGAAKSMEKLSSGFRINRAGDDAAGLAISEKMRGQIRGLKQASRNAQDGISLIQTAEGALNETHAILQRMRELAVQSSTDTNTNADRLEIQKEIDQLATEITRISTDTEFNTMKLLDESYEGKKFHIGANEKQNVTIDIADMGAKNLSVEGFFDETELTGVTGVFVGNRDTENTISINFASAAGNDADAITSTTAEINDDGSITVTLAQAAGSGGAPGAITATAADVAKALESVGLDVRLDVSASSDPIASVPATASTIALATTADDEKGINVSSQE